MAPDIPGAKRAGLPVDLDRLTAEGDEWLSGEERYALKMHGLCAQAQPRPIIPPVSDRERNFDGPRAGRAERHVGHEELLPARVRTRHRASKA